MLVLSRKQGESLVIADTITIKIISSNNGVVKIGIDAPHDVRILRSELLKAVGESNKQAQSTSNENLLLSLKEKFKL